MGRASGAKKLHVLPPQPDGGFDAFLEESGQAPLRRAPVTTLQVNVGKRCNQACNHCHVEAGPKRTEVMPDDVMDRVLHLIEANPSLETVDITGGAPELHPRFTELVARAHALGREVIDRCNLTILLEPGMEDLARFLAAHRVRVVASLPCYQESNVERQRGRGVFDRSIRALRRLNDLGYARPGSGLRLDLVYNPGGASLPPEQAALEAKYKEELSGRYGVAFDQLLTLTNMPIRRFAHALEREGELESYMDLLVRSFNPATLESVMCRSLVSVGWDGALYDCDFNQMLELPLATGGLRAATVWDVSSFEALSGQRVATGSHCFGCTAGAGSSCSGALS
ncbi:MAG: arsenosugar biosynthesis radical SAM (seleno)protein ArsS [Myxococcota bacterium]